MLLLRYRTPIGVTRLYKKNKTKFALLGVTQFAKVTPNGAKILHMLFYKRVAHYMGIENAIILIKV